MPIILLILLFTLSVLHLLEAALVGATSDPGLGWHIKTGEYILENGIIPTTDPFLALPSTLSARNWVSDQWLADILLYLNFSAGDWQGLFLVTVFMFSLSFFIIPAFTSTELGVGAIAAGASAFMVTKLATVQLLARPVQWSFLFFSVLFLLLLRARRKELVFLPVLFILWANLHPGFVTGLLLLMMWGAKELLNKHFKFPVLICAASFLATFINPRGYHLHTSIAALGSSSYFMTLHQEWRALSFSSSEGELFIYVCAFVLYGLRKIPHKWLLLPIVFFAAWSISTVRILPYFAVVASPAIAYALQAIITPFSKPVRDSSLKIYCGITGIFALLLIGSLPLLANVSSRFKPRDNYFPYDSVSFLKRCCSHAKPCTVASISDWGGFITLQGEGKLKPVIDDRNTLIGEAWYKQVTSWVEQCEQLDTLRTQFGDPWLLISHRFAEDCLAKNTGVIHRVFSDKIGVVARFNDDRTSASR